ncbi:MAG: GntR family transcriptional regulator [Rhizobiales bacterium]|nr:GntR family transcriptional regulator [Hyphomicrobiales bacterium]
MTRATAAEEVVRILRDRILSGVLEEGTALRQEKIAGELGVSRIPVREALKQLEVEGLVKIVSHSGAVVAELSLDEIRQTFELRAVVESWLLSAAIPFMSGEDLAEAEAIIAEMDHSGIETWGEMNWRFHERLYRPAGRDHITAMIRKIHEGTDRYIYMHMKVTDGRRKAQSDHRHILELCRAKDLHRAVAVLEAHILDVADRLTESVEAARRSAMAGRPRRRRRTAQPQ